ncbi:BrnA antitoxin family protein [Chromobacterium sp. IIBBL 290-4]|uniref:BrnA antitoxin family protein n=1 Tax=Chromobacterium sp. IIBBL 290-4 TaxID=2953890 RepID=UPI0020B6F9AB|nr:BrnA antitoxin family protein [Chromobacterium sp. IIBBL 290-4]UTH72229.1 BrnA antitoxin family protein [Chromobacterium sp. IIBBL 290-4]
MSDLDIDGDVDQWESGELGRSAEHATTASAQHAQDIDDALGLKSISIRLQANLIEDLKVLARLSGIGYQPLARQILTRYVNDEMHKLAIDRATELAAKRS